MLKNCFESHNFCKVEEMELEIFMATMLLLTQMFLLEF